MPCQRSAPGKQACAPRRTGDRFTRALSLRGPGISRPLGSLKAALPVIHVPKRDENRVRALSVKRRSNPPALRPGIQARHS